MLYSCVKYLVYILLFGSVAALIAGKTDGRYLALALALIPVCLFLSWLKKQLWVRENEKKPLMCVEAKLIRRREACCGTRLASPRKFFLTFSKTDAGDEMEFEVSREEYARIQVGATGPLAYRGNQYLSFRKPVG